MMSSDFRIVVTSRVREEDGVWSRAHIQLQMASDLILGLHGGFTDIAISLSFITYMCMTYILILKIKSLFSFEVLSIAMTNS